MLQIEYAVSTGFGHKAPAGFVVNLGGMRLLLDLGRTGAAAPDPDRIGRVDAVLLSHQHPDHAGALDQLAALGNPPVYASRAVAQWLGITARTLELLGRQAIGPLTLTTGRNGHAPGGVWLHLSTGTEALLYTGDVVPDSPVHPYDPPPSADTLILDASYGMRVFEPSIRRRLSGQMLALSRPLLLPAPATGRALELALVLQSAGRAPMLCQRTQAAFEAAMASPAILTPEARDGCARLLAGPGPDANACRIVDDPGLVQSGNRELAREVRAAGGTVCLTGHVPPGTPAAGLLEAGEACWLGWPAHPDLEQNRDLVKAVGAGRILPAFCEPEVGEQLMARLRDPDTPMP